MLQQNGIRMTKEEIEKVKNLDWDSIKKEEEIASGMTNCSRCGSILITEIHSVCWKCGKHV
jgi:ribosomal protein S27AE